MPERGSIDAEFSRKLKVEYDQRLVSLDGDQVIHVPNVPAMSRKSASGHLEKADLTGLDIAYGFAKNTEDYLIKKGENPPFTPERLIEASGQRWDEERAAELKSRDFSNQIRQGSAK